MTKPQYSEPQVVAVRTYCDRVCPAAPGGVRCSFPKCWHAACAGEIQRGLRDAARQEMVRA